MATSMFESILSMITPEMKQSIAARLDELPQSVQSGLGTATAATLTSLAHKAGDSAFIDQLMQLASRASSQNVVGSLASIASSGPTGGLGELASRFLSLVFGTQQGSVEKLVSQQAGLSAASGSNLLKMAAQLILGYFAKLHAAGTLSAGALSSALRAEAPNLGSYVSTGFLKGVGGNVGETTGRVLRGVESRASAIGRTRWAIPAAIGAALLIAWFGWRSMHTGGQTTQDITNTAMNAAGDAATTVWAALGDFSKVTLPDGTELNIPSRGVEARLIEYLQDTSAPVGEITGFDFDRLLFDTNQATLKPASSDQLNNVAAILKAYPTAKIRLGGYTDSTGDADANRRLSAARADNVMAELTQRGIDSGRLSATGYGEENPVADNSTEDGRQKNRRISIRVAEK